MFRTAGDRPRRRRVSRCPVIPGPSSPTCARCRRPPAASPSIVSASAIVSGRPHGSDPLAGRDAMQVESRPLDRPGDAPRGRPHRGARVVVIEPCAVVVLVARQSSGPTLMPATKARPLGECGGRAGPCGWARAWSEAPGVDQSSMGRWLLGRAGQSQVEYGVDSPPGEPSPGEVLAPRGRSAVGQEPASPRPTRRCPGALDPDVADPRALERAPAPCPLATG